MQIMIRMYFLEIHTSNLRSMKLTKKAMNIHGIPNKKAILRIAKMDNPRALDILQQATLLQEQNRTNP